MTAALEGDEWSAARPGRTLPPGKTRYPFYRRLGGAHGRSERAEKLVPTGIRSRTVQPGSSVAIPTELPGPHYATYFTKFTFPANSLLGKGECVSIYRKLASCLRETKLYMCSRVRREAKK